MSEGVLHGIRVIDLSRNIAGLYCSRLLAGWGAEVVLIEPPDAGDLLSETCRLYLNVGKKSLTVNLDTAEGIAIFKQLAANSDAVIEDFPPGSMQKRGIDFTVLEKLNPRVVMTSITGFGQDGPYSGYKATPLVSYAMGGQMYVNGEAGREPLYCRVPIPEYITGLYAFIGTMLALESVTQNGKGHQADISVMECLAASHQYTLTWPSYSGSVLVRPGWPGLRTPNSIYACRDGYINLRLQNIDMSFLAYLFNLPELADDPRFLTPNDRFTHRTELEAIVSSKMAGISKKEIFRVAGEWRQLSGYVATMEDLLSDPQYDERDFWVEVEHPKAGRMRCPGAPVKIESLWQSNRMSLHGEHNEEMNDMHKNSGA